MLLFLMISTVALAAPVAPDFDSEQPFTLNGLYVGMEAQKLAVQLGDPIKSLNEQTDVYQGNLVVRRRGEEVVNLAVSDTSGKWRLSQGGTDLLKSGAPVPLAHSFLGQPGTRLFNKNLKLTVDFYPGALFDLGVLEAKGVVVGFILSEPGLLVESLTGAGYSRVEAP